MTASFRVARLPRKREVALATSLLLAAGLAACGKGEPEPPRETTLPVQKVQLRVELMSPAPDLSGALRAWQSREGVEVVIDARDASTQTGQACALREVDVDELGALMATDEIEAFATSSAELQSRFLGTDPCVRDGEVYAIPWRTDFLALAARGRVVAESDSVEAVPSWQALAHLTREVGPVAVDTDSGARLVHSYLALLWSAGGAVVDSTTGRTKLQTEAGIEALSFLARLVQDGSRLPADEVEPAFARGDAGVVPVDLARLHRLRSADSESEITLIPFPAFGPGRGQPQVFLRPRVFVLPRGGPHADLAADLALLLAAQGMNRDDSPSAEPRFLPVLRDVERPSDALLAAAFDLRDLGRTLPANPRASAIHAALERAVVATLDRRRHPELALADADRELQ
jgi:hypothetical protein